MLLRAGVLTGTGPAVSVLYLGKAKGSKSDGASNFTELIVWADSQPMEKSPKTTTETYAIGGAIVKANLCVL